MDEKIEKQIKELYEKAQYHKNIANNLREKLENFLETPLSEPQEDMATLGDGVREVRRLENLREIVLEEIFENEHALNKYYREKEEEQQRLLSVKIYEKPHTLMSLITNLKNKTMTFSDLVKYFQRICKGFNNKEN